MSKEKQTAEEVLKKRLTYIITCQDYNLILDDIKKYANQQTSEMQKEIDELRYNSNKLNALVKINTELREHLNLVSGESIIGIIKRIQEKYTTLKQSADKMAKMLTATKAVFLDDSSICIKCNAALENYKKLI